MVFHVFFFVIFLLEFVLTMYGATNHVTCVTGGIFLKNRAEECFARWFRGGRMEPRSCFHIFMFLFSLCMARKSVSVDGGNLSVAGEKAAAGREDSQKVTKGTNDDHATSKPR